MFFWKKWTKRKPTPQIRRRTRSGTETRRMYRASFEFPITYTAEGRDDVREAIAGDLSAGGLRLIGTEDFLERSELQLCFTLPFEMIKDVHVEKEVVETTPRGKTKKIIMIPPEPFREMTVRGKVVIYYFNVRRRRFAHGVQFIDIDEKTSEEISRFIHVWQIHQLRARARTR